MRVKAKERGFYGCLREPDTEFEFSDKKPATWMEPVGVQAQDSQPPNGTDAGAFKAFHVGGGRYGIKDGAGERVGEFTGSQAEAEAEAARMNGAQDEPNPGDLPDA